jgi:hypothetical protein
MVTHKKDDIGPVADFYVAATITEPKYSAEWKYLKTETAYVERKLESHAGWGWNWISWPGWGLYSHGDWVSYKDKLERYSKQLAKYADDVHEGMLPLKFSIFNDSDEEDSSIRVKVHVKHGRLDEHRKVPTRPERLDSRGKGWPKIAVPNLLGFTRSGIKITEHMVAAQLSALGSREGAGLITDVIHLHTGPETEVTYEIKSRNVSHEMGEVELQEPAHSEQSPDSST